MMLQVIAYALAISVALSLAACCAEKLSAMLGRPRTVLLGRDHDAVDPVAAGHDAVGAAGRSAGPCCGEG